MPQNNKLREQTQEYWRLSTIWNGRSQERVTTQLALIQLKNLITSLNPRRRLAMMCGALMADIILPKRTKKRKNLLAPVDISLVRNTMTTKQRSIAQ